MSAMYRLTPIHHWHQQHGAQFILEAGWKRVESYGRADEEAGAVRKTAGICDVTPLVKIDCQGKDVVSLLARHLAQSAVPDPGMHSRGRLSGDEHSGEIHIARLTAERVLVLGASDARESLLRSFSGCASDFGCAHVTDLTSAFAAIRLTGPSSAEVLKKICPLRLDGGGLAPGRCTQTPVARVSAVIMRDDLMDLMSYLILVSRDHGEYVWKSLMSAGEGYHIRQFGLSAERKFTEGIPDVAAV